VLLAALVDLILPSFGYARIFLSLALFGLILYGLVLIPLNLHAVGDRALRRALAVFFVLTLCFFPAMYVDAAMAYLPVLSMFRFLENLAQPLYFLALNALSIAFGLRYLNRPAYSEKDELTEYFLKKFAVTRREREIIRMLLQGAGGKEIGDKLFISPKTVENHIYNIYQKLGVKNRIQLFQLIRANALE